MTRNEAGSLCWLARCLLTVCGAIVLAQSDAAAFQEPEGFGKAKFGMKEGDVLALYPKMPLASTPPADGAAPPFQLTAYRLDDQSVGSLRHCSVQLRFLDDSMFDVQVQCPDKAAVEAYLAKTYGSPTNTYDTPNGKNRMWKGKKSLVSHMTNTSNFMFGDVQGTERLNRLLMALMFQPKASSTPGAVPAEGALAPQN